MKYGIVSDLHLERYPRHVADYMIDLINNAECDEIIIAGDIDENNYERLEFLNRIRKPYFEVMGNHDYYETYLKDDFKEGCGISGGTLWTNFDNSISLAIACQQVLRDFKNILCFDELVGFDRMVSPDDMVNIFNAQKKRILETKNKVVVTHFPPCHLSIHPRFMGDYYAPYFVNNLYEELLNTDIKLWVHGHVHDEFDYTLDNGMRVVCNPLGKETERKDYTSYKVKIVEV